MSLKHENQIVFPIHFPSVNALNITGINMQLTLHEHAVLLFKCPLDCAKKAPDSA